MVTKTQTPLSATPTRLTIWVLSSKRYCCIAHELKLPAGACHHALDFPSRIWDCRSSAAGSNPGQNYPSKKQMVLNTSG